jgi:hypothetical protein
MTDAGRRVEAWLREYWPFILIGAVVMPLMAGVLAIKTRQHREIIACRQQGLDYLPEVWSLGGMVCVPRAGHGVDTIIVRTP